LQVPEGHDADHLRAVILKNFNMSLGMGLARLKGKVFRIGHLGDCNDLSLMAALTGVEMGLTLAGIPHKKGGVDAAMAYLVECAAEPSTKAGLSSVPLGASVAA
jgi:alanine-glyoxylate transaminase/serine-glyoxylate transaminase/serine-pyruvate transaminase